MNLYELHFAFRQRWIMSDLSAVKAVLFGWKLFVSDLEAIQHDTRFEKDWERAKLIQTKITTRSFVLGLCFMFDLLKGLGTFSQRAQESAGILIGKEIFQQNLFNLPVQLKDKNGPRVIALLHSSVCSGSSGTHCTAEEFLTSERVVYDSILLKMDQVPTAFLELRLNFLTSLEAELRGYFPEGSYALFEVFVPQHLPKTESEAFVYGHSEIQQLAETFNLNPALASTEWTDLLVSMILEDGYCNNLNKKPEYFWPYYLKKKLISNGAALLLD